MRFVITLDIKDTDVAEGWHGDATGVAQSITARIGSEIYDADVNAYVPDVMDIAAYTDADEPVAIDLAKVIITDAPQGFGCADCGHTVDDHNGTGPCPHDNCQSFSDGHVPA